MQWTRWATALIVALCVANPSSWYSAVCKPPYSVSSDLISAKASIHHLHLTSDTLHPLHPSLLLSFLSMLAITVKKTIISSFCSQSGPRVCFRLWDPETSFVAGPKVVPRPKPPLELL
ncbi:hypothetical protein BGZ57DRAFT_285514 [Hyaloscypha finlandica]|nr:hypothetical protein BGZ57DRAFT_285514 [Hyaloscypha finlandica]